MPNTRNAGRKPKITTEQLTEIKARRQAGESVASLAAEFGVSRQALNKRLVEEREEAEVQLDYILDDEVCTSIFVDKKSGAIRLINYTLSLSKRAFGINDYPDWEELEQLLINHYLKSKGVKERSQLLCLDKSEDIDLNSLGDIKEKIIITKGKWVPRIEFSKSDRIINRTDTDGYQLKALTKDRKHFVKSQAIISGVLMRDWAVELIACDICKQLEIPCVQQHQCQFVYSGREFDGVYSENYELDGYTFISFERLLERMGKSSKEEEFITLDAINKLKWCAKQLADAGNLQYEDTEKYMLDLAVVDCLIGNIDRHARNFGLFYNVATAQYAIPLIFDNGMGLFENDYYRDNYKTYEEAMNYVYVAPYGEDPFEMMEMLNEEYDLKKLYPALTTFKYLPRIFTPFAMEYERRMIERWQK